MQMEKDLDIASRDSSGALFDSQNMFPRGTCQKGIGIKHKHLDGAHGQGSPRGSANVESRTETKRKQNANAPCLYKIIRARDPKQC